MLTMNDIRYFIDPLNNPAIARETQSEKRILITETARDRYLCSSRSDPYQHHELVGKVVAPEGMVHNGNRFWYAYDGMVVDGPIVNPSRYSLRQAIGIRDDVFIFGNVYSADASKALLENWRRSDQKRVPGIVDDRSQEVVDTYVAAAPWAADCFPVATDDDATVALKLELAKKKWLLRKSYAEIIRQADDRRWKSPMDDLRERIDLPSPRYTSFIDGAMTMMVRNSPVEADMPARVSERLTTMRSNLGQPFRVRSERVEVGVQFVATGITKESHDEAQELTHGEVTNALRATMDDYDLSISDFTARPVLNGLA